MDTNHVSPKNIHMKGQIDSILESVCDKLCKRVFLDFQVQEKAVRGYSKYIIMVNI